MSLSRHTVIRRYGGVRVIGGRITNGHDCIRGGGSRLVVDKHLRLLVAQVLAWVDSLVLESLDELVESDCDERAECRPNPLFERVSMKSAGAKWISTYVNPMVSMEFSCHNCGAE